MYHRRGRHCQRVRNSRLPAGTSEERPTDSKGHLRERAGGGDSGAGTPGGLRQGLRDKAGPPYPGPPSFPRHQSHYPLERQLPDRTAREDDLTDLYIIKKDIFPKTCEPAADGGAAR